jgi:hypothetical protein
VRRAHSRVWALRVNSFAAPGHRILIALHTVRKIAYNLSNNYDGDRLIEEHVEIEEEI